LTIFELDTALYQDKISNNQQHSFRGPVMRVIKTPLLILLIAIFVSGCAAMGSSPQEKRSNILAMKRQVLNDLYKTKPQVKAMIKKAPGYAVFSNANVNLIFASFGGGYGVVKNNRTGKHTYMRMGEVGLGLGLGVKDFRAVFVFHDSHTMNKFIHSGWEFGGHADAAAKASGKGGAIGGEVLVDNISIYQLTESGLALQATVKGTKYWKDKELN
jgi:lipid-binding SYLF domain-containing protein